MTWLLLVLPVLAAAMAAAAVIQRRSRPDAPTQPRQMAVPAVLDRADFERPTAPWLVAVFTSATCDACEGAMARAVPLDSSSVVVQSVEFPARRDLHDRYAIDSVPLVAVADADGVVRASFLGVPSSADLWAAVAELRRPGSVPAGCDHHGSAG